MLMSYISFVLTASANFILDRFSFPGEVFFSKI